MVEGQGFEPWPHVVGEVLLEDMSLLDNLKVKNRRVSIKSIII